MNFKRWFYEWAGAAFPGTPGPDGTGNYGDLAGQTKYNGHGASYGAPSFGKKVDKMFGIKPEIVVKKIKKTI